MAITIRNTRKAHDCDDSIIDFLCDTEDDVARLPTQARGANGVAATGSTATVVTPGEGKGHKRMLVSSGVWVESPDRIIIDCGTPSTH